MAEREEGTSPDVPDPWRDLLDRDLEGTLMVVGGPDSGKTTFARWIYRQLTAHNRGRIGYLDADPGQSQLGPPTTISLGISDTHDRGFPPTGRSWHWPVGSTTPSGHMLPQLVGLARLQNRAEAEGTRTTVIDTCGLISPRGGGHALKVAEVDLLRPSFVVSLGSTPDLQGFLQPLRRTDMTELIELGVAPSARRRSAEERAKHRADLYKSHFESTVRHELTLEEWSIFPPVRLDAGRLAALCDDRAFVRALAVAEGPQRGTRFTLITPLESLEPVRSIRLADVVLNLSTHRDRLERLPQPF